MTSCAVILAETAQPDYPSPELVLKTSQITKLPILQWHIGNIADQNLAIAGRLVLVMLKQIRTESEIML